MAGHAQSNNGDVTGYHGGRDYWVVKLDGSGNIQWQKCLGGTGAENAYSIQHTADGGYIVAGSSLSNNGDVAGNHGGYDYWVVKLDGSGNIQWQKCLGGTNYDEAYSIQQTADGGYVVAGWAGSNNGDVSGNHSSSDFWLVKLSVDSITNNPALTFSDETEIVMLWPNPVKEHLNMAVHLSTASEITVQALTVFGQIVATEKLKGAQGENRFAIPVSKWPA